jgi:hypothetical protein
MLSCPLQKYFLVLGGGGVRGRGGEHDVLLSSLIFPTIVVFRCTLIVITYPISYSLLKYIFHVKIQEFVTVLRIHDILVWPGSADSCP